MDGSSRGELLCIRQLEQNFTVDQILAVGHASSLIVCSSTCNTHVTDYLKSIAVYIFPSFTRPRACRRNGDLFVAPIQHIVFVHVCIYLFKSVSYLGPAGPFNLTHSFHYPNLNPTRIARRKPPQTHDSKTDPKILNLISEAFFLVAEI